MRRWTPIVLSLFLTALMLPAHSFAQKDQADAQRKVVSKTAPAYPQIAREMNIRGVVRLVADVTPNGSVKTVKTIGGHPVLAQAAETAILRWKWEPAKTETQEPIEVRFDPE